MENKLNLPENFESYPEARKAGFMRMKQLKDQGAKVVGMFCSFVPMELVYAAGALPVGLCAFTDEPIPAAEANLPRNLCPLIKASYGFALTDTCPYFYFSDLVVGETTCDGKKKMFELLNEIKETYVMQLPHSRDAAALAFWKGQIIAFKEKLEEKFNITITEEAIREAIRRKNRERQVMKAYLELGKLDPAPMSGYEMGTRIDAGMFSFDLDQRCDIIEKRTAEVIAEWKATKEGKPSVRPRLLVTGCPNAGVREKIIRAVEEMGADTVPPPHQPPQTSERTSLVTQHRAATGPPTWGGAESGRLLRPQAGSQGPGGTRAPGFGDSSPEYSQEQPGLGCGERLGARLWAWS